MIKTSRGAEVPDNWTSYAGPDVDGFEELQCPMWDTRNFVTAATTNLRFFTPTGAGATVDLTNISFPLTEPFLLKAIGVFFKVRPRTTDQGASAAAMAGLMDDLAQIMNTGWLDIGLGKLGFGPFPLWKLGAGGGLDARMTGSGAEAAAQVSEYGQIGSPNTDGLFKLQKPFILPENTQIPIEMKWAGVLTIASTPVPICLYLDGVTARR